MKDRERRVRAGFAAGVMVTLIALSIIEDVMGRVRWQRWETANWSSLWVDVPICLFGLWWAVWKVRHALEDDAEPERSRSDWP